MPVKSALKSRNLDEKDAKIIMVLQKNGRESLTNIAREVGLSIDSVNNRIKSMLEKNIFYYGIFVRPSGVGFPLITDVKIKLNNITAEEKEDFITYLKNHPRVIELISIMGDYDFTCVLISKDTEEFEKISTQIRQKYNNIIADWKALLILKVHKFEYYDLTQQFDSGKK